MPPPRFPSHARAKHSTDESLMVDERDADESSHTCPADREGGRESFDSVLFERKEECALSIRRTPSNFAPRALAKRGSSIGGRTLAAQRRGTPSRGDRGRAPSERHRSASLGAPQAPRPARAH